MQKKSREQPLSRRAFLKAAGHIALGGAAASAGLGVYGAKLEPSWLKLERLRIPITGLPVAFDGYRLIQLTDLHLITEASRQLIDRAVSMVLERAPDLITLTGDYVSEHLDAGGLYDALRPLAATDGVWASLGNHDHWVDAGGVRQVLADAGIKELSNSSTMIMREGAAIWLAGVDDIWERHHDLSAALADVPADGQVILLAHEPDYADQVYPTGRVALQLSGHSHGGQVRLPLIGAPVLPYLGRKYPYGLRCLGDMWLYTNRGVGNLIPVRVNCRPEVTEITLVRA